METDSAPVSRGFFQRIRSYVSDASTGWEEDTETADRKSRFRQPTSSSSDLLHFHDAIRSGNREVVEQFVKQYRDIADVKDPHQRDALQVAAVSGNVDMARYIAGHSQSECAFSYWKVNVFT